MSLQKIFFAFVLCISTGLAFGKTQVQQDKETFKELFASLADSGGADLLTCGMKTERDQLIQSAIFLMDGYNKLNKNFPLADPPIDAQIRERNQYMHSLLNRGNSDNSSYCQTVKSFSAPSLIERFENAERKLKDRLKKAGYVPSGSSDRKISSAVQLDGACSARSKYYQDEFQRTGSTDALVCAKKALERELR